MVHVARMNVVNGILNFNRDMRTDETTWNILLKYPVALVITLYTYTIQFFMLLYRLLVESTLSLCLEDLEDYKQIEQH
jgi:hypothetical protein